MAFAAKKAIPETSAHRPGLGTLSLSLSFGLSPSYRIHIMVLSVLMDACSRPPAKSRLVAFPLQPPVSRPARKKECLTRWLPDICLPAIYTTNACRQLARHLRILSWRENLHRLSIVLGVVLTVAQNLAHPSCPRRCWFPCKGRGGAPSVFSAFFCEQAAKALCFLEGWLSKISRDGLFRPWHCCGSADLE